MSSKGGRIWTRLADRNLAMEKRKAQAAALLEVSQKPPRSAPAAPQPDVTTVQAETPAPEAPVRSDRPWAHVRSGNAGLTYRARATHEPVALQPWAKGLVDVVLDAAYGGGISLCLVWPAKMTSLPLIHALANVERLFAKDLRGLRTLYYPGNHACRAPLHSALANRTAFSDLCRTLYVPSSNGTVVATNTSSTAMRGALEALNEIRIRHEELPDPSLAELVPTFVFDPKDRAWAPTGSNALERTLTKIDRLAYRADVRQRVGTEWRNPQTAPGALMVIHHSAKREAWRTAFSASALAGDGRPEVLLLDATSATSRGSDYAATRIPDFLADARGRFADAGAVIVTDDPKMFFILRSQLMKARLAFSTKVWAAEADDVLLASRPQADDWVPAYRTNSNFNVSIVDRDASQVALAFQRLMDSVGNDANGGREALLNACLYILRLSNMPAGYADLVAISLEAGESDFASQQNAWTPVRQALDRALESGAMNAIRSTVQKAITDAEKLIDQWNDATPMAARLQHEVQKYAIESRQGISIVLPNGRYIQLARHFLARKLGDGWANIEANIEWHTLSAVAKTLTGDRRGKHFAFVGISRDVLRILISHPAIPNRTAVLVAYRQADATLTTLRGMKEVDAFKPYRGRIGLLAQALEQRLAEVPRPITIGNLRDMPMTFRFEEASQSASGEQEYYKFELEGGGRAFSAGWIYRHEPDADPPFRRAAASSIQAGDFIFDMSDELRAKLEATLRLNTEGISSIADPVRMLLKFYHDDVQSRSAQMCSSDKRAVMAREIHAKMLEVDAGSSECAPGRVSYWLDLNTNGDTRPHAAGDARFFKVFCKALGIADDSAQQYWTVIRKARQVSQYLGRVLVARYAEILFQPESANIYRNVPNELIRRLHQDALRCVYRVERVIAPVRAVANR